MLLLEVETTNKRLEESGSRYRYGYLPTLSGGHGLVLHTPQGGSLRLDWNESTPKELIDAIDTDFEQYLGEK